MNALWLERMSRYRNGEHCVPTAQRIVEIKIHRRSILLRRYHMPTYPKSALPAESLNAVRLYEARAAKHFWKQYALLLPDWIQFSGRQPHRNDIGNILLDIGYHHITNLIEKTLETRRVSPALGLMHIAGTRNSAPLAYDLVELFRADLVDAEVLRFFRLKKRPFNKVTSEHIGHLLHEVNERLERKYYLRDFKQCHTYRYYLELQIIKFIKAVNRKEIFEPLHLPARHESRCP